MLSRRSFGKGAAAVSMPRRPDQAYVPPSAVLPAQSQSGRFARLFVGGDFLITSTGAFFYTGIPALGNPPITWITPFSTTVDPYGNALPASGGVVTSNLSDLIGQLVNAEVIFFDTNFVPLNKAQVGLGAVGGTTQQLVLRSGNVSTDVESIMQLTSATGGNAQIRQQTSKVLIVTGTGAGSTSALLEVQGSISTTGTLEAVVSGAVETWHAANYAGGSGNFADFGAPFAPAGFQYEPINGGRYRLRGIVSLTANHLAGATIFFLPNPVPVYVQNFATQTTLSGYAAGNATIQVTAAGAVNIVPSGSNTNIVALDGIVIELD